MPIIFKPVPQSLHKEIYIQNMRGEKRGLRVVRAFTSAGTPIVAPVARLVECVLSMRNEEVLITE
jgi:hypothetical protein